MVNKKRARRSMDSKAVWGIVIGAVLLAIIVFFFRFQVVDVNFSPPSKLMEVGSSDLSEGLRTGGGTVRPADLGGSEIGVAEMWQAEIGTTCCKCTVRGTWGLVSFYSWDYIDTCFGIPLAVGCYQVEPKKCGGYYSVAD